MVGGLWVFLFSFQGAGGGGGVVANLFVNKNLFFCKERFLKEIQELRRVWDAVVIFFPDASRAGRLRRKRSTF